MPGLLSWMLRGMPNFNLLPSPDETRLLNCALTCLPPRSSCRLLHGYMSRERTLEPQRSAPPLVPDLPYRLVNIGARLRRKLLSLAGPILIHSKPVNFMDRRVLLKGFVEH